MAMTKAQRQEKANEKRVERAYYATCNGIQINMMDIPRVFKHGVALIASKPEITDEELGAGVRSFVDTIKVG